MTPHEDRSLPILLVESNERDRMAIQHAMQAGGIDYRLTICERPEEAEHLLTEGNDAFSLVVMDYNLPGMNGLDFF